MHTTHLPDKQQIQQCTSTPWNSRDICRQHGGSAPPKAETRHPQQLTCGVSGQPQHQSTYWRFFRCARRFTMLVFCTICCRFCSRRLGPSSSPLCSSEASFTFFFFYFTLNPMLWVNSGYDTGVPVLLDLEDRGVCCSRSTHNDTSKAKRIEGPDLQLKTS